MATNEEIEIVRQGLMRFQELLEIMRQQVETGEAAYQRLIADDVNENLREKEMLWRVAQRIVDDPSELSKAASRMRFHGRDMEREFEHLYNNIVSRKDNLE